MNQINPYNKNCRVLKKFFSKKTIFLLGLLLLFPIPFTGLNLFYSVQSFIYDSGQIVPCILYGANFLISLLGILPAVACFRLFADSKRDNDGASLKPSFTLIKVYSVLSIAVTLLSAGGIIYLHIVNPEIFVGTDFFRLTILQLYLPVSLIYSVLACTAVCQLFLFCSLYILASSLKKSITTIYFHKTGAIALSVFSVLMILPILCRFLYTLFTEYSNRLDMIASENALLLYLIILIFLSAVSLSFSSFVNKLNRIIFVSAQKNDSPAELPDNRQENSSDKPNAKNPYAPQQPNPTPLQEVFTPVAVRFEPQAVSFEPEPDGNKSESAEEINLEPTDKTPQISPDNPYITDISDTVKCPKCGYEFSASLPFCGSCGNKI